jgi:hypothetical protein
MNENALARPGDGRNFDTLLDEDKLREAVKSGSDTGRAALEFRRQQIETDSIRMDAILDRFMNPPEDKPIPPGKKQEMMLQLFSLGLCTVVHSLSYIGDCVSRREKAGAKNKLGFKRMTIVEVMDDTATMLAGLVSWPDKDGQVKDKRDLGEVGVLMHVMNQHFAILEGMLHMGATNVHAEIFKGPLLDDNGVPVTKDGKEVIVDDVFAGERSQVSTPTGKKKMSDLKAQIREADEFEVVTQEELDAQARKTREELEKDKRRA